MAQDQPRNSKGQFSKAEPASTPASAPADQAAESAVGEMNQFKQSIKGFTESVNENSSLIGKNAKAEQEITKSRIAGVLNQTRKDAGFTSEQLTQEAFGNNPMMNMLSSGITELLFGKKDDDDGPEHETAENTERMADAMEFQGKHATEEKREQTKFWEKMLGKKEKREKDIVSGTLGVEPKTEKTTSSAFVKLIKTVLLVKAIVKLAPLLFRGVMFIFKGLLGLVKLIPRAFSFLLRGGGKFFLNILKKIMWPVTALIGIWKFVEGFIAGYKEGGIMEGFKEGFANVIDDMIDVPLNMLKDGLSWAMKLFGWDDAAADLDEFEFDFAGGFRDIWDTVTEWIDGVWESVTNGIKTMVRKSNDWINEKTMGAFGESEEDAIAREESEKIKEEELAKQKKIDETQEYGAIKQMPGESGSGRPKINGVVPLDDEDAEFLEEMQEFKAKSKPKAVPEPVDPNADKYNENWTKEDSDKFKAHRAKKKAERAAKSQVEKVKKTKKESFVDNSSKTASAVDDDLDGSDFRGVASVHNKPEQENAYQRKKRKMREKRDKRKNQAEQIKAAGGTTGTFRMGKLVEVDGKALNTDARSDASTHLQKAALENSGSSGNVVINQQGGGDSSGGGGAKSQPVPIPMPMEITTDATLATPAQ